MSYHFTKLRRGARGGGQNVLAHCLQIYNSEIILSVDSLNILLPGQSLNSENKFCLSEPLFHL